MGAVLDSAHESVFARLVEFALGARRDTRDGLHLDKGYWEGTTFHRDFCLNAIVPALGRHLDLAQATVLEVGAGKGFVAAFLALAGAKKVIATDSWDQREQPDSVRIWRNLCSKYDFGDIVRVNDNGVDFNPERLQFLEMSAEDLRLDSESIDAAYSVNSFEHFGDPARAALEMSRVLRVDGMVFVHTEPLFYSRVGSHVYDLLPMPWGHVLFPAERLVETYEKHFAGRDRIPSGEPVTADWMKNILRGYLNGMKPAEFRAAFSAAAFVPMEFRNLVDLANLDIPGLADLLSRRGTPEDIKTTGIRAVFRKSRGQPRDLAETAARYAGARVRFEVKTRALAALPKVLRLLTRS